MPSQERLRAGPLLPRRPLVRREAAGGLPRPRRGQAPPRARHAGIRAVRGRQGGALAPAAGSVLVRRVGDEEMQQAGDVHRRRRAPMRGGPRLRAQRGGRRARRLRRHRSRRLHGRGRRHLRAPMGRRPDGQLRPDAAAQAPVHEAGGPGGLQREVVSPRGPRRLPRLGAAQGPRRGPQGPARRERPARLVRRGRGHGPLAEAGRGRRPRLGGALGSESGGGGRARRVRRGGRPRRLRRRPEDARGRWPPCR